MCLCSPTPGAPCGLRGPHSIQGGGQLLPQAREVGPIQAPSIRETGQSPLLRLQSPPTPPGTPASIGPPRLARSTRASYSSPVPSFPPVPVHTDQQLLNPDLLLTSCSGLGSGSCGQTASRVPNLAFPCSAMLRYSLPPASRLWCRLLGLGSACGSVGPEEISLRHYSQLREEDYYSQKPFRVGLEIRKPPRPLLGGD